MNFFKYQVIFTFVFFVSSAISANVDQDVTVPQRFNTFTEDFWFMVAQYLLIPHKELGFLNKVASRAVFKYFPLQKVMSGRFPTIEGVDKLNKADDLIALKNLFYSSDEFHRFQAIGTALVNNEAFPHNGNLISRYVFRDYVSLPPDYFPLLDVEIMDVAKFASKALERKDFDLLVKTFTKVASKFRAFFENLISNSDLATAFFKQSFCDDLNTLSVYETFYNSLNLENLRFLFIFHSILARVPEHFYWHHFVSFRVCSGTLYNLFTKTFMDIDEAKCAEIYNLIGRLLDQIEQVIQNNNNNNNEQDFVLTHASVDQYRLLNRIRFGSDDVDFETEIKSCPFEYYNFPIVTAILANRLELAHTMLKEEKMEIFLSARGLDDFQFDPDCRVIVNCFDLLPQNEKQKAFTYGDFLSNLIKVYDARAMQKISVDKLAIDFRVKERKKSRSLPNSFKFVFDLQDSICRFKDLPKMLLKDNRTTDEEGLYSIFAGLISSITYILPLVDPIPVEIELVRTILKSEPLRNIVLESLLKLIVSNEDFAKLLFEPLVPLQRILVLENLDRLLLILYSKTQFRNLEAFLNSNIAEILINARIFSYGSLQPSILFFRLRFALHYWLEGPQRARIFEVPIAFRELLAKECCEKDKSFLLQTN